MPPVCWHMVTARLAAKRLGSTLLSDAPGSYLLGATAPDVRIMTGQPREDTHYITLEADHPEDSIENLLAANPHVTQLTGRPRAFVAGYFTHIEIDQAWIREVYRPFFGRESTYHNTLQAHFMDRTLQFYMDWKERLDRDLVNAFYQDVVAPELVQEAALIPPETLSQWQGFVKQILHNEPSWDWFSDFLQRRLKAETGVSEMDMRDLASNLPDVLETVLNYVTPARLAAFKEDAVRRQMAALRSYLQ